MDHDDKLEFLLSQIGDGARGDAGALPQDAKSDPRNAVLAARYERLAALLRDYAGATSVPASFDQTDRYVAAIREEWAYLVSQGMDGPLPTELAARVERALSRDPQTRRLAAGFERTDALVRAAAGPVPEIDYAGFAARVRARVRSAAGAARATAAPRRARTLRVGVPVALAAALLLSVVAWWNLATQPAGPRPAGAPAPLVVVKLVRPADSGSVEVAFDQTPPQSLPLIPRDSLQAGIAGGSSSAERGDVRVDDGAAAALMY